MIDSYLNCCFLGIDNKFEIEDKNFVLEIHLLGIKCLE